MATAKYIFTSSNGQLLVTLDNSLSEFDSDEVLSYRGSSIQLFSKSINLFDFGEFVKAFKFQNIKTIDGNIPSSIENAQALLLALLPSLSGSSTSSAKTEDSVAVSGDTGNFILGVRRDSLVVSASATGDYSEIATDKYGAVLIKDQTRHKRTYSLAFTVATGVTATDIFQIIGSATTTVSVNRMSISGTQTTGGQTTVTIAKRSTANTGGTSSAPNMVAHDSTDSTATAVGAIYTANPTVGTAVGDLRKFALPLGAVTTTTNNIVELDFGVRGKPIVLNGVTQAMVISLGGVTLTGGSINIWIEFTEE